MLKRLVVCDVCGKLADDKKDEPFRTPRSWFRIQSITMKHRPYRFVKEQIEDKNILRVGDVDPDFCSRVCLTKWFVKNIDMISKK